MSNAKKRKDAAGDLEQAIDEATEAVTVRAHQLEELALGSTAEGGLGLGLLLDVPVQVTVEVGRARLSFGQLMELAPGSLVDLDREAHEPADLLVNGKVVARGEIVTLDGHYGLRVTKVES